MNWQMNNILQMKKLQVKHYETVLSHVSPKDMLQQKRLRLNDALERMQQLMEQRMVSARHQMALYAEELKGLSPLYKLQGGYSYVSDMEGKNVRSVEVLEKGQRLNLSMADGKAVVTVEEIEKG